LLTRLERARPKLIVLVAPAGYGKTTLARQVAQGRASAVCDCGFIEGRADFITRLLATLASSSPEARPSLERAQLAVGSESDERFGVEAALEAWTLPCADSVFTFENLERLLELGTCDDLLARCLVSRPESRVVIICSRLPLRLRLTRFAAPHEIVFLQAAELAFTAQETRSFFPRAQRPMTPAIVHICRGWPIAVLLLARFAREGTLDAVMRRFEDVAFGELYAYLWDEVLGSVRPEILPGLIACAMPAVTNLEVAWALDDDTERIAALTKWTQAMPFISRTELDGVYDVHPLIRATIEARFAAELRGLLLATAERRRDRGEVVRAAALFGAAGEARRAAEALNEIPLGNQPSTPAFLQTLASIDPTVIARFPLLWLYSYRERRFSMSPQTLLDEIERMWEGLARDLDAEHEFTILRLLIVALGRVGKDREAEALVERYAQKFAPEQAPRDLAQALLLHLVGYLRLRAGRLREWSRIHAAIAPFFAASSALAEAVRVERASYELPMLGRFEEASKIMQQLVEQARRGGGKALEISVLFGVTVSTWLCGDDEAFAKSAAEMRDIAERYQVRGAQFFLDCAHGRTDASPGGLDSLNSQIFGHLIACGFAETPELARGHARSAHRAAVELGLPFTRLLSALFRAELDAAHRAELREELRELAGGIESDPLRHAVAGYLADRGDDLGMLAPFVRRVRNLAQHVREDIEISIFSGAVHCAGDSLRVSERELQFLLVLARRQAPVHRDALGDMLWPELDGAAARNALKVCVHRVRQRLGRENAIVKCERGYRLGAGIRVDLWRAEARISALRGRASLDEQSKQELAGIHRTLLAGLPAFAREWEWFAPTARRIDELRLEVAERLATSAIENGDVEEALRLAREISAHDPHDEIGCKIAMNALYARGDEIGAQREFRRYCEWLARELDAKPSGALLELAHARRGRSPKLTGSRA
jgi:DNA-binding SARP family transcriptional activator